MCWMLTVAGPPTASDLPERFRSCGGVMPEPDAAVAVLFRPGDGCFSIGAGCACSLYRAEATEADRLRRTAARRGWPDKLLRQRLERVGEWVGLAPQVREAVASAAEAWGRAGVLLRWADNSARVTVTGRSVAYPDQLRRDAAAVAPDVLVTVRAIAPPTTRTPP